MLDKVYPKSMRVSFISRENASIVKESESTVLAAAIFIFKSNDKKAISQLKNS